MKKVQLLVIMLLLLSSCAIIEIMQFEKTADKIEINCNNQCQQYEETSNYWCNCMYECMNTGKMKIRLSKCESDSTEG